jgi:hypothetical protein
MATSCALCPCIDRCWGIQWPLRPWWSLDKRIAIIRANIRQLTEQATALSGAGDETRTADRIAEQELLLAQLLEERKSFGK